MEEVRTAVSLRKGFVFFRNVVSLGAVCFSLEVDFG